MVSLPYFLFLILGRVDEVFFPDAAEHLIQIFSSFIFRHRQVVEQVVAAVLCRLSRNLALEIGDKLSAELGIKNGERIKVSSVRGEMECVAMVTKRMTPFTVEGKVVHQVGLPFNYGWRFPEDAPDASANCLSIAVGCPNTDCPEYKAFMVNVSKAEGI